MTLNELFLSGLFSESVSESSSLGGDRELNVSTQKSAQHMIGALYASLSSCHSAQVGLYFQHILAAKVII